MESVVFTPPFRELIIRHPPQIKTHTIQADRNSYIVPYDSTTVRYFALLHLLPQEWG